ncbi:MAG: transcription elongation factor GreA [bacterium]|nr:transcription elongation factor GreA [bacterium]
MRNILLTKAGYVKLENEYKDLQLKRKEAILNLKTARDMGDLSENAAYRVARSKLSSIDSRIRYLEKVLRFAHITTPSNNVKVQIGHQVTIKDITNKLLKYTIVDTQESDISNNLISVWSPIGKSLLNKSINDEIIVPTPQGIKKFILLEITYDKNK